MNHIKVKVVNQSANELPKYQTAHSAGMDLRSVVENDILLEPLERVLVGTGLFIELPEGYHAEIYPRSSITKYNIMLKNSVGIIDNTYRGNLKIRFIWIRWGLELNLRAKFLGKQ